MTQRVTPLPQRLATAGMCFGTLACRRPRYRPLLAYSPVPWPGDGQGTAACLPRAHIVASVCARIDSLPVAPPVAPRPLIRGPACRCGSTLPVTTVCLPLPHVPRSIWPCACPQPMTLPLPPFPLVLGPARSCGSTMPVRKVCLPPADICRTVWLCACAQAVALPVAPLPHIHATARVCLNAVSVTTAWLRLAHMLGSIHTRPGAPPMRPSITPEPLVLVAARERDGPLPVEIICLPLSDIIAPSAQVSLPQPWRCSYVFLGLQMTS
jgi:hypothetical protein